MRLCMSESSGELTPPLESPEEVSKTGQMLAGLLAASPEPVTLGMLAEWTGNSSEEVQTELVRLGYNPLTPVGELGVLLRVSQKELSDETEKLQKRHGVDEIRSEKDIPGVYGNERLDYAVRLIKLKSLREQLEEAEKNPDSVKSRYDEPVYGLNPKQYEAAQKLLDDSDFMEYNGIIAINALRKIDSLLGKLGLG